MPNTRRRQLEERPQRMEEPMVQLVESPSRTLSHVDPKVEELPSRYGDPDNAVSPPTGDSARNVAGPSSANSCKRAKLSSTTVSAQGTRPANAPGSSTPSPTSLHEAAAQGDVAALERMLAAGERVDARDKQGNTPLHVAAAHGREAAVTCLIEKVTLVDCSGEKARTPLHFAAAGGHDWTVELLLLARASVRVKDAGGQTAFILAAAGGHLPTVRRLVTQGATVNVKDADGYTALARAAAGGYLDVVKYLCAFRTSLNVRDARGCSPLCHAVKGGHLPVVAYLLTKGASPILANKEGETPMYIAAQKGYGDILADMLEICPLNGEKKTKLLLVAGSAEVVWVMADVARNLVLGPPGQEALRQAAGDGRLEVVEALLKVGVNANAMKYRFGALHFAAEKGHASCVGAILQADADPNLRTNCRVRATALHIAASAGHAACIRELLKGGADKSIANRLGHTALQLAKGNPECVRLLQ